jgi:hypothetical protein
MIHGEPRLQDILQDPIIVALAHSDGISLEDVIRAFENARRALGGNQLP